MRWMLSTHGTQADWQGFCALPREEVEAHIAFVMDLEGHLRASGELVSAEGLTGPEAAQVVQARCGGAATVMAAPFPAARVFLARYWVIDCDGPERAIEIAARVSASPGRGGVPRNVPVEVRQVMRAAGEEM